MENSISILHGNIVYSKDLNHIEIAEDSYLVAIDGIVEGIYNHFPSKYLNIDCKDYGDAIIIPGMIDLHLHAPQYSFRGFGMDSELLEWLNTNTFPEESKYKDLNYAKKAYTVFVENLKRSTTTRACIFATIHRESTILLMNLLEKTGMITYVGKVNMDRNSPDYLSESTALQSYDETRNWIMEANEQSYKNTFPILTPRFIPSCSDELLKLLSKLIDEFKLPVQSHLSENRSEIKWVQELCPCSSSYADAYNQFDLFGSKSKTIMAHCVYSTRQELDLIKRNGVYIAHCPESNVNLSSGIAPIKKYLEYGLHVGLGSDLAAGTTENLWKAMAFAIQMSKIRRVYEDDLFKPLTVEEVFYLATKGGGSFFGKVGSFETGYEFDAIVLDDSRLNHAQDLDIRKRLERMIYLADEREIISKFVKGNQII